MTEKRTVCRDPATHKVEESYRLTGVMQENNMLRKASLGVHKKTDMERCIIQKSKDSTD